MSGIFASMNTATKGLMAQQTALHTTGHNISNVNTEGFTRQRVDMQADKAFNFAGVGQLGTGVKMQGIVRMIDNHVSKQLRTENSTLNRFTEKSDVINQLEVIFNEPSDTGLSFNIGEMFEAFQNLSGAPGDINFKTVAVEKMKTLTDTINHMAKQIDGLEAETHEEIDKNVLDFNTSIGQLNDLNKQIFNISIKGQVPNDLLDQRDMILKDLSAIAEVKTDLDGYGRVEVKLGGKDILGYTGSQKYIGYDSHSKTINLANADGKFISEGGNILKVDEKGDVSYADPKINEDGNNATLVEIEVENGKILGNMDAIGDVKTSRKELDELAVTLAKAINTVHGKITYDVDDGAEGAKPETGNIFVFDGSDGASGIKTNEALISDNTLLKGGKDVTSAAEDNTTALALAGLRTKKISINDAGEIIVDDSKGRTIGSSYRDMVIKIGVSKQHSDNMVDNQISLTNQLEMRRESVSGVSLNDEITNVIKFQKAYEANAKVISALTEMLDTLINRTGV